MIADVHARRDRRAVRNIERKPHSRLERQVLRAPAGFLDSLHR
jgi:hypothetical protein